MAPLEAAQRVTTLVAPRGPESPSLALATQDSSLGGSAEGDLANPPAGSGAILDSEANQKPVAEIMASAIEKIEFQSFTLVLVGTDVYAFLNPRASKSNIKLQVVGRRRQERLRVRCVLQ